MAASIFNSSGVKIKTPSKFAEDYDKSLNVRRFGTDNLYPNHINDFFENSPTFNRCANRLKETLFGKGTNSKLITNKILKSILLDYAKFNGFALHICYNGLGDIVNVDYVPFETIRLGEQGTNGKYTYCYYCPDWSGTATINTKKVNVKTDKVKYYMFTDNIETRLSRIESCAGSYIGEILYFSNNISYPVSNANAVLNYISAEVGLANITYRDVRSNFLPASVLSIPKQSDEDANDFANNLTDLQGDENAFKVILFEHATDNDKPEVLNLQGEDFMVRYQNVISDCENKILGAFGQEMFKRLLDGSLGFGSETISEIYKYYNWSLRTVRAEIESVLQYIDPTFKIEEVLYENTNLTNIPTQQDV